MSFEVAILHANCAHSIKRIAALASSRLAPYLPELKLNAIIKANNLEQYDEHSK
jgi:hypothetical protein